MNFRRVVTALAVMALFAGLASAQVPVPQSMSCAVSAATTPSLRSEGITEKVGDVILTCTSSSVPQNSTADRTTVAVNFGVPVTSATVGSGVEALLTIDEPNTVATASATYVGYGANAPVSVCSAATNTSATSCPAFYYNVFAPNTFGAAGAIYAVAAATTGTAAQNVYQGTVGTSGSGLQTVTFANVPVVLTGQANIQRVFRITNVRVTPSASPVTATVTVTPASNASVVLTLANNGVTVGTPAASLVTSLNNVSGAESLCVSPALNAPLAGASYTKANLAILQFKEAFNNAFKTRVLPNTTNAAGDAQSSGAWQTNIQGTYTVNKVAYTTAASESGTNIAIGSATAGLATTGTRLKAVFTGLDKNATYYVSLNNITDFATLAGTVPPVGAGDWTNKPYAVLLSGSTSASEISGYTYATSSVSANGVVPVVQLTVPSSGASAGTAEVVWEVTNDTVGSANTFNFALYAVYTPTTAAPTVGNTATVTLGYAPTSVPVATPATGFMTAIPRFAAPAMTPANFFNVVLCQTTLLFPYVTNANGFETGLAISNTSADPFGTPATSGACSMYFYGANQPTTAITLTSPTGATTIGAGQQISNTVSALQLSNFAGYAIAVCNFQYGHGFAFLQTTKGTLSMGYLSLVMNTTGRGQTLVGEGFQQ